MKSSDIFNKNYKNSASNWIGFVKIAAVVNGENMS
jgi:hypothetical protein